MVSSPALELLGAVKPREAAAPVPPSTISPAVLPTESETFGIPTGATLLRSLLAEVRKLIEARGVSIEDVYHNQYQEVYYFRREAESARIDIAYNSKNKITGVAAPHLSELGAELTSLLSALKGLPLVVSNESTAAEVHFSKQFLNDFHAKMLTLCDVTGITVQKVVEQQWCQRYSFSKGSEVAVYDVWYNGKDQFTRCQPVITACSPGALVGEVGQLITQGIKE